MRPALPHRAPHIRPSERRPLPLLPSLTARQPAAYTSGAPSLAVNEGGTRSSRRRRRRQYAKAVEEAYGSRGGGGGGVGSEGRGGPTCGAAADRAWPPEEPRPSPFSALPLSPSRPGGASLSSSIAPSTPRPMAASSTGTGATPPASGLRHLCIRLSPMPHLRPYLCLRCREQGSLLPTPPSLRGRAHAEVRGTTRKGGPRARWAGEQGRRRRAGTTVGRRRRREGRGFLEL